MSATLFAIVVLQGTSLSFSPGYTSAKECLQQYKGPFVSCFAYDPDATTWTAFFKLPDGGFRTVGRITSEDECKRYIGAFRDDVPAACRQLALPNTCNVACVKTIEPPSPPPPPPPAAKPEPVITPKPDPASLTYRLGQECETGWSQQQCARWRLEAAPAIATAQPAIAPASAGSCCAIQLAGGRYQMPGFVWVSDEMEMDGRHYSRTGLVWALEERGKETVTGLDPVGNKVEAPKPRNLPTQTQQPAEPFKALVDVVMLPFAFLIYPGRRDW
jgi:hypothetical protein